MGKRYNSTYLSRQVNEQTELFNNFLRIPGADAAWTGWPAPSDRPDRLDQTCNAPSSQAIRHKNT